MSSDHATQNLRTTSIGRSMLLLPRSSIGEQLQCGRPSTGPLPYSTLIGAMAELVNEAGVGGLPVECGADPVRGRALIEQEHLGEGVTEPCTRFVVRAGDRSWRTCSHCGGLSELRHGRVRAVPDHVAAGGAVIHKDPAE